MLSNNIVKVLHKTIEVTNMATTLSDKEKIYRSQRKSDPYVDRRSGADRREVYSLDYFSAGNPDRRNDLERRSESERRNNCIRVSEWSSVCPEYESDSGRTVFFIPALP